MCMGAAKGRDPEVYGSWLISSVQRYLLVQARRKLIFQLLVFLGDQFKQFDVAVQTKLEQHKIWIFMEYELTPVSFPGKYFKRTMQEFWLYKFLVLSSTLESGPV